jgi:hypothetical protein
MHVGIDQSRDEESSAAVDPPQVRTSMQMRADFRDPAITDNNIGMTQRSGTFR